MSTLKTKEAIFKHIPKLTDEDYKMLNEEFTPYLFFKDHKKEECRECWCTHCGKHFIYNYVQRTEPPQHYEFIRAKHNEQVMCPKCNKYVTAKETFRMRTCGSLEEWKRIVLIKRKSKKEVYLLCYFGHKDYYNRDFLAEPNYFLSVVYYLTPDLVKNYKREYDYTFLGIKDDTFRERKSICEPYTKTYAYNYSLLENRGYTVIGLKNLKNTFMEYAPLSLFDDEYEKHFYRWHSRYYGYHPGEAPLCKMLCYYALYPSIERLMKVDLGEFACNLIDGRPMKRVIDWKANTPKEMFHMNSAQFNDFKEHYYGPIDFKVYQILKTIKKNIKYSTVVDLIENFAGDSAVRVAQKIKQYNLNITHTFNYLKKNTRKEKSQYVGILGFDYEKTAIMWTDYLKFAKELKYDLSREDILFPKNLKESHDTASSNVAVVKDEKAFEQYKKRYETLKKKYEFSDDTYQIVIPNGVNDIVAEGSALCHCVKGYAERHMKGATTILFVRRCDQPDARLITIEINGKKIVQNRGMANRPPTKQEQDFIDKWIAWVQAGSKRPKKTASAA